MLCGWFGGFVKEPRFLQLEAGQMDASGKLRSEKYNEVKMFFMNETI